jgi:hypothetical protein
MAGLSQFLNLPVDIDVEVTTFSDNVVISANKPKKSLPRFLSMAVGLQLATTMQGFLMRGGITMGNIVHDKRAVFGPALNRAYELESKIAKYPRVIFDPDIPELNVNIEHTAVENGLRFLDPFTLECMIWCGDSDLSRLAIIQNHLDARLAQPLADKEFEKLAWLYDRIATQLNVPSAISRTRTRPK